jgi:hypothetical protein
VLLRRAGEDDARVGAAAQEDKPRVAQVEGRRAPAIGRERHQARRRRAGQLRGPRAVPQRDLLEVEGSTQIMGSPERGRRLHGC